MTTEDAQAAEKVALTDAEREVLRERLASWFGDSRQAFLVSDLAPTVERIVAARVAEAVERERAKHPRVEIQASGAQPATCQVYFGAEMIFSGVAMAALLSADDTEALEAAKAEAWEAGWQAGRLWGQGGPDVLTSNPHAGGEA